jgi:rhomboid protease GluP
MGVAGRILLRLFDDTAALLDLLGARGTWWEWRKRLWRRRLEERLDRGLVRSAAELIPAQRVATTLLISANVGMMLLVLALRGVGEGRAGLFGLLSPSGEALFDFGAKWGPAIHAGQLWRLLTASYLHGGLVHLLFNSFALASLGPLIEEAFGARRLFFLYTVTGVAAFAVSTLVSPYSLSIGASGAIFGLIGFAFVFGRYRGGAQGRMIADQLLRWILYGVVMFFLFPGIDNAAHFGGLAAGAVFGLVLHPGEPRDRAGRLLWDLLAGAALVVTLGSFVLMAMAQGAAGGRL